MKSLLISLGLLLATSAIAGDFSQNASTAYGIQTTPVSVNSMTIPGPGACQSVLPPYLPVPNMVAAVEVVLNYGLPTAPACSGYGCLPNVTVLKNGTPLAFQSAGATSEGLVYVFDGANAGDSLELRLSHASGTGWLFPAWGAKAILRGSTFCP